MPIKCRLLDKEPDWNEEKPGDMFYITMIDSEGTESQELVVILPNGGRFYIIRAATKGDGTGVWEISGEPPNLTVTPSIDSYHGPHRRWHGYLKNGILSDDIAGRKYD